MAPFWRQEFLYGSTIIAESVHPCLQPCPVDIVSSGYFVKLATECGNEICLTFGPRPVSEKVLPAPYPLVWRLVRLLSSSGSPCREQYPGLRTRSRLLCSLFPAIQYAKDDSKNECRMEVMWTLQTYYYGAQRLLLQEVS